MRGLHVIIRFVLALVFFAAMSAVSPLLLSAQPLALSPVGSGFSQPVSVTASPGDSTRLYVIELGGRIKLIKNNVLLPDPFLDISALMCPIAENGLLGMTFDPNYMVNGFFYVRYTDTVCDEHIARFRRSANPDLADSTSEQLVLFIDQPDNPDHNGGRIAFGPDGYLYIPTGDGHCCGDPDNAAADPHSLRGKLLRIDVSSLPYQIPLTNPFRTSVDTLPEIIAYGLRNPFQFSFDRSTGDLYIGDVGQDSWEEIDYVAAGSTWPINFGWPEIEGRHCYRSCDSVGTRLPMFDYSHGDGCSVNGGYVYRGCGVPSLQGRYLFSDFCNGRVWSLTTNGTDMTSFIEHTSDIGLGGGVSGFGEDAAGELYQINVGSGDIYKIVSIPPPATCTAGCCIDPTAGNCDCTGSIDIGDLTVLVDNLFISFAPLCCEAAGNADGTGAVDIGDLTALVDFLFISFTPLAPCQ